VQRQFRDKTLSSELKTIDWSHPHFWAAWQLSGDGGALPMGDRLPR
jgi:CHAT domain-containing protein